MGIDAISQRISDIQSRILALQGKDATPASGTAVASPAGDFAGQPSSPFAAQLQQAVAATPAATVASAVSGRSYAVNAQGIPVRLAQYGNGRIPASALEQVDDTGFRLWAPAAESMTRMIGDARKDGVSIGINETYRPYDEQVDLARQKGLYSQGGLAAKPGTSEHGWGMAADLHLNSSALAWMRTNAKNYGYVNDVARESWHWAYKP